VTDKMPEDLRWLAENVSEWDERFIWACVERQYVNSNPSLFWSNIIEDDHKVTQIGFDQWQAARQQIEDERMDIIGQNGNGGEHYDSVMTPEEESDYGPSRLRHPEDVVPTWNCRCAIVTDPKPRSKYHVEIRPGVWVDVYDVLHAFRVTNPGDQHALKKLLKPGQRGHKDANQDRREAVDSIFRAIELEGK